MVQLTIEVPDELAFRLQPNQNRLVEIIELGLREITPAEYTLHSELIEFLASGPTPQNIVSFQPSADVTTRVIELLEKNKDGSLNAAEQVELDQYETLDYLMTLVKARARVHLAHAA